MSKIHRLAGLSLATALACGLATSANAQLLQHKDLSSAIATTIALTAVDVCKEQGYNVSVHVVGRNGEVLVGLRHHAAGVNTFENSFKKAYTARTFRIASGKFAENVGQNPVAWQLFLSINPAELCPLPVRKVDATVGVVCVYDASGDGKDEVCALRGIYKVKDQLR